MEKIRLNKKNSGRHAIILSDNAEFSDFLQWGQKIEIKLNISYNKKIDDFDTHYWIFDFMEASVIYCYNIYTGLQLYLADEKNEQDQEKIFILFELLKSL